MAKSCPVPLLPWQSIKIFGLWDQPRTMLSWIETKQRKLTWGFLRELEISSDELIQLQPNKKEWICAGCICAEDCVDAIDLGIHPFNDLCLDLAQLWKFKFSASNLKKMNVTYDDLYKNGMNPEIMFYFSFTLSSWIELGFRQRHLVNEHAQVFNMSCKELSSILSQIENQTKNTEQAQ